MVKFAQNHQGINQGQRARGWVPFLALLLPCCAVSGCAALTNPGAEGIPARRLPPELLAPSKNESQTIPLNFLRQPPPPTYRLEPGDVLGAYVEGFLGDRNQPLPLHVGPHVDVVGQYRLPPAAGYPVPVQENGTIALPNLETLRIQGLTLAEAREAVRSQYLGKKLLRPENERILVTLLYPRQYRVLVFREESEQFTLGPDDLTWSRRGTGFVTDLPAYENDVLHALARTGGLPGLDVFNEVIIFRGCFHDAKTCQTLLQQLNGGQDGLHLVERFCPPAQVIHIPLRLPPGQLPQVQLEDIILQTGDVVYLRARDKEVFFTGGLLPPGRYTLPRDHDLDVLEAVAQVRGPLFNGAFGGSNLSGDLVAPGIGNPSPTQLTVLRRTADGRQVSILVDLGRAVRHSEERILVQEGDFLILQEKPGEALTRYFTQTFLNFEMFWQAIRGDSVTALFSIAAPDRLPDRLGQINISR